MCTLILNGAQNMKVSLLCLFLQVQEVCVGLWFVKTCPIAQALRLNYWLVDSFVSLKYASDRIHWLEIHVLGNKPKMHTAPGVRYQILSNRWKLTYNKDEWSRLGRHLWRNPISVQGQDALFSSSSGLYDPMHTPPFPFCLSHRNSEPLHQTFTRFY